MERLVLVALGDSLTAGFRSSGSSVPYTYFLKLKIAEMLSKAGSRFKVKIYNRGVNGDTTLGMLNRFRRDVVSLKPRCVIILGGSNDIGWGVPVEEIYSNLKRMYVKALEEHITPVACAVPSILGFDSLIPPRRKLNQMIKHYCTENGLPFVDLFTATADPHTGRLLKQYSDDGLHLTEEGYRRIAEEIFAGALKEMVKRCLEG
jgi:lysophospholipase L1-like esterase